MRKLISAAMAVIMVFTFCACAPKEEPPAQPEQHVPTITTYEGNAIQFTYNEDYLEAVTDEDGEAFQYSLTAKGADPYSVPRIDMFSVSLEGFDEDPEAVKEGFERFVFSLCSGYFEITEDGPAIDFKDTSFENGDIKHLYTKALVEATEEMPALIVEANVFGVDKGAAVVSVYQTDLDEESLKVMADVISSVKFTNKIEVKTE